MPGRLSPTGAGARPGADGVRTIDLLVVQSTAERAACSLRAAERARQGPEEALRRAQAGPSG